MNELALEITGARRRFGETQALDGAGFTISKGERIALLGPNGAGKTTLIRAVGGLANLDEGTVNLFGQPATDELRYHLGIVPQDLAVQSTLSAEENLHLFGRLNRVTGNTLKDRIEEALRWTGLEDRRKHIVKGFSGGMKRRLNIACGVLHQPDIVLLDEPTVGVDPQSRARIHEMLDELHDRGTALLLTTHMMEEAARCTDRVVVIDHGKTIANGTLEELVVQNFGEGRQVNVTLSGESRPPSDRWTIEGHLLTCNIAHASELSTVLNELASNQLPIEGIEVKSPTLEDVFLHLTGRDLRE
ncbi:MAG: ABC transporter ATP-binding protein [Phycisphaerales bacterium]|nr:ABC transporter ATP-binding protein [Phycisphaerales bacterium]